MSTLPSVSRWKCLIQSLKKGNTPLTRLNQILAQKGPTIKVYTGGIYPMILTADPDFIQHILQKNPKKYLKTNKHFESIKNFWGNGLLTSEGTYWLKQRRLIQPGFHKNRLRAIMTLMDRNTEDFLQNLDNKLLENPKLQNRGRFVLKLTLSWLNYQVICTMKQFVCSFPLPSMSCSFLTL